MLQRQLKSDLLRYLRGKGFRSDLFDGTTFDRCLLRALLQDWWACQIDEADLELLVPPATSLGQKRKRTSTGMPPPPPAIPALLDLGISSGPSGGGDVAARQDVIPYREEVYQTRQMRLVL